MYRQILNAIACKAITKKPAKPNFNLAIGEAEDLGSQPLTIYNQVKNTTPTLNLALYQEWSKSATPFENEQIPDGITGELYLGEVVS